MWLLCLVPESRIDLAPALVNMRSGQEERQRQVTLDLRCVCQDRGAQGLAACSVHVCSYRVPWSSSEGSYHPSLWNIIALLFNRHSSLYQPFIKQQREWWASQVALVVKNPPAIVEDIRDTVSIPGLGRSPGGGHGNPLQYSCLENPMNREAWQATAHRVAKSRT